MKALTLTILLFFSFLLHASDYEYLAHKTYAQRQRALIRDFYHNDIFQDSTAFFTEVNQLRKVAIKYHDNELLLETELMFYNFFSSKKYPAYKEGMKLLIAKIDNTSYTQLKARARQALGLHYYYEEMAYAKAISWLRESADYLDKLTEKELPDKQEMVFNIAMVYFNIGYNETSLQYLKIAEKLTNPYYESLVLNIINTKGLIYRSQSKQQHMSATFYQLLDSSIEKKDGNWVRIAQNNLAEMYRSQGNIKKAFELLNRNYPFINDDQIEKGIYIRRLQIFANLYIETKQQTLALQTIEKIEPLMEFTEDYGLKLVNLPLKAYTAGSKGDFNQAYNLIDSALKNTNELTKKRFSNLVKQSESKDEIENYFRQKAELEHEKKVNRLIVVSSIIIVILIILTGITFFQKQQSIYKQKKLKMALEKKIVSDQLELANQELDRLTLSLKSQNEQIETYRAELDQILISNSNDQKVLQQATHLNELLNKPILTDESWITFKQAFEKVHIGFIDRLNQQLPGLTQAELRYIVLQKMNLSGKEIASILGISFDSIRSYKFRIRKKFSLTQDDEIKKIIDEI